MELNLKDNMLMEKNMEQANLNGVMVVIMKVNLKTIILKAKENMFGGKIIKLK
jgi:hypothetical protein